MLAQDQVLVDVATRWGATAPETPCVLRLEHSILHPALQFGSPLDISTGPLGQLATNVYPGRGVSQVKAQMVDRNGQRRAVVVEAFDNCYTLFFLIQRQRLLELGRRVRAVTREQRGGEAGRPQLWERHRRRQRLAAWTWAFVRATTAKPTLRARQCHTKLVHPAESVRTVGGDLGSQGLGEPIGQRPPPGRVR